MDALFDKTIEMLSGVLDFQSQRHKVIASNIANIDTPNYRPKDIVFKEELKTLISNKNMVKIDKTDFEVIDTGEMVDLDSEMAKLAENNLMHNLTVELLARKFSGLNTVLKEIK
ncbi:MAG: flagellar basal body rod protein FlgB [Desulfobacterales bacterium]|nr:flagellar basal body rod protein FlgB [Desulfobacterales bacterium]